MGLLDIALEVLHTVAESIKWDAKALDALHLATVLLIGEPATVATHDAIMNPVALAA